MSCQKCKYKFCWVCFANWNEREANTCGYNQCNKFDASYGVDDQSDAASGPGSDFINSKNVLFATLSLTSCCKSSENISRLMLSLFCFVFTVSHILITFTMR